jgi:hypothetical protein
MFFHHWVTLRLGTVQEMEWSGIISVQSLKVVVVVLLMYRASGLV